MKFMSKGLFTWKWEICPGLNANEIQIPHGKHHKVSSLVKSHQNTHNSVPYAVMLKCQITLPNMKYYNHVIKVGGRTQFSSGYMYA